MDYAKVCRLISDRRNDQIKKFPEEHLGHTWMEPQDKRYVILGEEVGEIARAMLDHDKDNLLQELLDVAALCVAWIESDYD